MRALLDVNVLIALLDADHSPHGRATEWFASHAPAGWVSCPRPRTVVCLRIMSHPGYPGALPVRAMVQLLEEPSASVHPVFWPDVLSLLDALRFDCTRLPG